MTKIVLKETGREVKIGDKLTINLDSPFGELSTTLIVDANTLNNLVTYGLAVKKVRVPEAPLLTVDAVIEHLAKRVGWKMGNVVKYLGNLNNLCKRAAFTVLLHECAYMLDERYTNHISKSGEFWIIAYNREGQLTTARYPKFVPHLPMFRTKEDADLALKALEVIFPQSSSDGKQKN